GGAVRRDAGLAVAVRSVIGREQLLERLAELGLGLDERDAVLGALRARQRGLDVAEVELERVGVRRLLGVLVVPQPLLARVGLDELELLARPAGELEVADGLGVDGEDRA